MDDKVTNVVVRLSFKGRPRREVAVGPLSATENQESVSGEATDVEYGRWTGGLLIPGVERSG